MQALGIATHGIPGWGQEKTSGNSAAPAHPLNLEGQRWNPATLGPSLHCDLVCSIALKVTGAVLGPTSAGASQQLETGDQPAGPRSIKLAEPAARGSLVLAPWKWLVYAQQKLEGLRGDTMAMRGPILCCFNYGPHLVPGREDFRHS